MPALAIILIVIALTLVLILLADARNDLWLNDRLAHQRALAEIEYGDIPRIPTIEQPRGE